MVERRFRVSWKNKDTGVSGHGEYLPRQKAKAELSREQGVQRAEGGNVVHRLEIEPEPELETIFPKPAGQFSTDNWQSDRNQIAAEKGPDEDDDEEYR
jgi:hypothetical protein